SKLHFLGNSEFVKELIEPLTLRCSFLASNENAHQDSSVQFMYILHESNGIIATISRDQPVPKTSQKLSSIILQGELNETISKNSYLLVTWRNAKFSNSGKYFCGAHVNNVIGQRDLFQEELVVSVQRPTHDDLVKVVHELQRLVDKWKDSQQFSEQNISNINDDLRTYNNSMMSVKEDLKNNQQNIESFRKDLTTSQQNIQSVKEDFKINQRHIETVKDDLKMTKQNIESVKDDLKMTKQNVESVKDDLKMTKQNVESVKDDLKMTKQNVESVKDDLKMTKQNVESVKDDLKMTKQNIESVKDDLNMTKQNVESVKDDLKMTKQNVESFKDDLKMTKQNIESVKDDLKITKQSNENVNKEMKMNQQNMDTFKQDIESVKENFKSSQEIIRRWTQTIYLLSANLSEFQSNVTKLINEGKTNYTFLDEPITSLLPESCRDVISTKDRVVVTLASGLKVMCDTKTDGGGWIIFQRRINGKVDFYRGWKEYRDGFGDYNIGEFYLGNENIFKLTSTKNYDLRIDLEFDNKKYYARYTHFDIWGEDDYYKLEINGYSGNAGDSLKYHNDTFFSTYDKDIMTSNCASHFTGAWWYKDCFFSNLNGYWESNYLNWNTLSRNTSVTLTEMKIREVDLN
ncbi:BgMFREP29, partial [Biomphalaria glabrata]